MESHVYKPEKPLGRGAFGEVGCFSSYNMGLVAIKKTASGLFYSKSDGKSALREVEILKRLNHPLIINVLDEWATTSADGDVQLYFVMPLQRSSLDWVLRTHKDMLTMEHVKFISVQIFCAIEYLHQLGIIHGDVKPSNILINEDCSIKVADFGLATVAPTRKKHIVTRWYRAPELLIGNLSQYSCHVDMWAIGCVFSDLLNLLLPFENRRVPLFPGKGSVQSRNGQDLHDTQLGTIISVMGFPKTDEIYGLQNRGKVVMRLKQLMLKGCHQVVSLDSLYSTVNDVWAVELLKRLLEFNPYTRISANDAVNHRFFQNEQGLIADFRNQRQAQGVIPPTVNTINSLNSVEEIRQFLFQQYRTI